MSAVEMNRLMTEEERAQAFRDFHAGHLQAQTRSLETIKTLLILWTVLAVVGVVFFVLAAIAG